MPGRPVVGAPYCAEQISEHVQTLADGTRIAQPAQKTIFYRDFLGRTRTEHILTLPPGAPDSTATAPVMVDIFDPVANTHYNLDVRGHIARKMYVPAPAAGQPSTPRIARESLGTQTFEGVLADGTRNTAPIPQARLATTARSSQSRKSGCLPN